jgi:hypothetical protein
LSSKSFSQLLAIEPVVSSELRADLPSTLQLAGAQLILLIQTSHL